MKHIVSRQTLRHQARHCATNGFRSLGIMVLDNLVRCGMIGVALKLLARGTVACVTEPAPRLLRLAVSAHCPDAHWRFLDVSFVTRSGIPARGQMPKRIPWSINPGSCSFRYTSRNRPPNTSRSPLSADNPALVKSSCTPSYEAHRSSAARRTSTAIPGRTFVGRRAELQQVKYSDGDKPEGEVQSEP